MTDRIGEFLVRINAMTPDQVGQVLDAQKSGDRRLFGEIAIELGFVRENSVKSYVEFLQGQLERRRDEDESPPRRTG